MHVLGATKRFVDGNELLAFGYRRSLSPCGEIGRGLGWSFVVLGWSHLGRLALAFFDNGCHWQASGTNAPEPIRHNPTIKTGRGTLSAASAVLIGAVT
jgi:hypothetical protein